MQALEQVQLIYVSTARRPFSERELLELLQQARSRNVAKGITGLLMYDQGALLQVLEGERGAVTQLFERIARDPRHHRVTKIFESVIEERSFAGWSMGYAPLPGGPIVEALGPSAMDWSTPSPDESAPFALRVVDAFRQGRWRVQG